MRLVHQQGTRKEAKVGDIVQVDNQPYYLVDWMRPRHAASTGRVYVVPVQVVHEAMAKEDQDMDLQDWLNNWSEKGQHEEAYYPSVCNMEWIEREDRPELDLQPQREQPVAADRSTEPAEEVVTEGPTRKIVLHCAFGEFSLPPKVAEYMGLPWPEDRYKDVDRDDAKLVEAVEAVGPEDRESLVVVEIPAEVDWIIQDYDGQEWVAERHRTWSA